MFILQEYGGMRLGALFFEEIGNFEELAKIYDCTVMSFHELSKILRGDTLSK